MNHRAKKRHTMNQATRSDTFDQPHGVFSALVGLHPEIVARNLGGVPIDGGRNALSRFQPV